MQIIWGNELPLKNITMPVRCYCISLNGFVYDIFDYRYVVPESEFIHHFPAATRLMLVPYGKALCADDGQEIKVGMFLH